MRRFKKFSKRRGFRRNRGYKKTRRGSKSIFSIPLLIGIVIAWFVLKPKV